jgi:NitT/TauT family transport system permease protein
MNYKNKIIKILFFVTVILVWEILPRTPIIHPYILPPFSHVLKKMFHDLFFGDLFYNVKTSLIFLFVGLLISFILTIFCLIFSYISKNFKEIFLAVAIIFNSIPSLALLPIIIMWFGIGNLALIIFIIQGTFWLLGQHLINAMDNIPQVFKDFSKNIELSPIQNLIYVVFGCLVVDFISSLRIAYTRAWRSLIGAEIIFGAVGVSGGLGFYLNYNKAFGQMDGVFSGITIIAVVSLFIDKILFQNLERITLKKWGLKNDA